MTTMTAQQREKHEQLSMLLVIGFALLSLLIGWQVKTAVQYQTRPFSTPAIQAEIPSGWLAQDGAGELALLARNPQALDQRYRVTILSGGSELAAVAAGQNEARRQLEPSYRVLNETPIVVNGRYGYKVSTAFVNAEAEGMPSVIEGVDYYFADGEEVLIISFEADQTEFEAGFDQFQRFLTSVKLGGGSNE